MTTRLFAPKTDRTVVSDPPPETWGDLVEANRASLSGVEINLQGAAYQDLRQSARSEALTSAVQFTSELLDESVTVPVATASARVVATGHQPELFHPGVWIKNFAVDALARKLGGLGINLVVDNDRVKNLAVRVPAGPPDAPQIRWIPLDRWQGELPYEEHFVADEEQFSRFGDRVAEAVESLGLSPCVRRLWPLTLGVARRTRSLAVRIAGGRRRLERELGLNLLELPVSRLCRTDSFLWFASHIFAHAPRFHEVHNAVLSEYRREMGIRNPARPVPDLNHKDGWYEVPFWGWHREYPTRRPLFVRPLPGTTVLSDLRGWQLELPLDENRDACCAVERLRELLDAGSTRIRSRALTTTLYTRLFLSDLFVHGLGGAIYDRITDELIRRFYGMQPPAFATVSATIYLPVRRPDVDHAELVRLKQRLRQLLYNPQRFLANHPDEKVRALIRRKEELIRWVPENRRQRRERWRAFREVNAQLAAYLTDEVEQVRKQLAELSQALSVKRLLENREFPFCVYPLESLADFYSEFCRRI